MLLLNEKNIEDEKKKIADVSEHWISFGKKNVPLLDGPLFPQVAFRTGPTFVCFLLVYYLHKYIFSILYT